MVTDRTHEGLQALLGAFALDAVDGEEHDAVELHLRACPRCRAEVREHREVAALIGHAGAPAPEGVWDRIVEAMEPTPPRMRVVVDDDGRSAVAPFAPSPTPPSIRRRRPSTRIALAGLAAAAVIAAVLGVTAVRLNHRIQGLERQRETPGLTEVARAAWSDPRSRTAELRSVDGSVTAEVAVTASGEGYLKASGMPQLPASRSYQLWGVVGTQTISLGTFDGGDPVVPFKVHRSVKRVMVTEELAGGVAVSRHAPLLSSSI